MGIAIVSSPWKVLYVLKIPQLGSILHPIEDYDDTPGVEAYETDDSSTTQKNDATSANRDKNEPGELSQPGVGVQF